MQQCLFFEAGHRQGTWGAKQSTLSRGELCTSVPENAQGGYMHFILLSLDWCYCLPRCEFHKRLEERPRLPLNFPVPRIRTKTTRPKTLVLDL